jgi:hypothetical protein
MIFLQVYIEQLEVENEEIAAAEEEAKKRAHEQQQQAEQTIADLRRDVKELMRQPSSNHTPHRSPARRSPSPRRNPPIQYPGVVVIQQPEEERELEPPAETMAYISSLRPASSPTKPPPAPLPTREAGAASAAQTTPEQGPSLHDMTLYEDQPSIIGKAANVAKSPHRRLLVTDECTGCYLIWEEANQGSMYLLWSRSAVDDALAVFRPKDMSRIQNFKFTSSGGKTELKRNATPDGGPHVKRYMEGWTEYVKQARKHDAEVMVSEGCPAVLVLNLTDTTIVHVEPGQWYDVSKTGGPYELAVAAVSPYCTAFNVKTMQTQLFIQTGNNQATGAALLCHERG